MPAGSARPSRTDFDPRENWHRADNGMSVIVVDTMDRAYAVSFNVSQEAVPGAKPELNGKWLIERLHDLPSLQRFDLLTGVDVFELQYVNASKV